MEKRGFSLMPKITENTKLRDNFLEKLREKYDNEREGTHISSLVYCLRESFARKYMPLPQNLTTLFYFLDGEQRHTGLQSLISALEREKEIKAEGLVGTIDMFCPDVNEHPLNSPQIIEIKTTRAKPRGELSPHYLRQGAYYCILMKKTKFTLVTQHINHGDIIFYDIEFTPEELADYAKDLYAGRDILQKADEEVKIWRAEHGFLSPAEASQFLLQVFSKIPMVRDSMRWKCNMCLYHSFCYIEKEDQPKETLKKVKKK
jgi:CRISPR/Cas system-associated exonuclease Cas4 (RecB family)